MASGNEEHNTLYNVAIFNCKRSKIVIWCNALFIWQSNDQILQETKKQQQELKTEKL